MQHNLSRMPPRLRVRKIAAAAQALIDLLDELSGDPDLEDCTNVEDEGIQRHLQDDNAAGCPVADGGDVAWVEWDRMAPSSKHGPNTTGNIPGRFGEDNEDDDPREEDDHSGDPLDNGELDEGDCGHVRRYGIDQTRPIGPDNPEPEAA